MIARQGDAYAAVADLVEKVVDRGPFADGAHVIGHVEEVGEDGKVEHADAGGVEVVGVVRVFLVNTAVEKCIIGGNSLEAELKDIERQLSQNPLSEIIRLAYPSEKELEEIPAKQKKLYIYQKLQKELKLYNS